MPVEDLTDSRAWYSRAANLGYMTAHQGTAASLPGEREGSFKHGGCATGLRSAR